MAQKIPSLSARKLAEHFNCGKTQVCCILKNKAAIIEKYESNASNESKRSLKRSRISQFVDINDLLYDWYLMAVRKNMYPDGPILCQQAKEIAERLGITTFKASNGWLEKWKARHNIKRMVVCGESGEVKGETVESWKERLPEILQGYRAGIWTKQVVFGRHYLTKALGKKEKPAKVASNQSRDSQ